MTSTAVETKTNVIIGGPTSDDEEKSESESEKKSSKRTKSGKKKEGKVEAALPKNAIR